MTSETIFKFKTLFEEQRKRLIYSQLMVNEDFHLQKDDLLDEVDMTSTEMEQSMRIRLRNREALYLKKITEALRRIESGTFGRCEECDNDIESRRLEARPTATLCVACKEEAEHREQLHIDGHRPKSLGAKLRFSTG